MTPFERSLLIALLCGGSALFFVFALLALVGTVLTAVEWIIKLFWRGK